MCLCVCVCVSLGGLSEEGLGGGRLGGGDEEGGRLHISNRSLQSSFVLTGEDLQRLTGRSNPRTNLQSLSCSVFSCCKEVMVVVVGTGLGGGMRACVPSLTVCQDRADRSIVQADDFAD